MVFFSFSTRQEYYTMPAWPPLAILIGMAIDRAESEKLRVLSWLQAIPAFIVHDEKTAAVGVPTQNLPR